MGYERSPTEWHDLSRAGYPGVSVQVADVAGRTRIVGLQITRPDGVEPDDLRIPLSRVEATAAADLARRVDAVAEPESVRVLAVTTPPSLRELRIPTRLRVPQGRRYRDELYERVAGLYERCVITGVAPGPALAEANGISRSTAHWWVREARERGFLPPAKKQGATG